MQEYVTVSSSSYDPAGLATKLNEKSSEGWNVVAIVPTGGDVTAFLSRDKKDATDKAEPAAAAGLAAGLAAEAATDDKKPDAPAEAVSEPAGWAVAPEKSESDAPVAAAAAATGVAAAQPAAAQPAAAQPAVAQPVAAQAAAAAAAPAVPAGWYADPAGRFELRYWDGSTWTEHVSRAGQQFTDAPVA